MWKIPLFQLSYDHQEMNAVQEVLSSGWLTMGPRTRRFEEEFSAYLGSDVSSVAVSSCTAALHLALIALGIGPGDEVVVPALTFVAAVNVVKHAGATPVLADSASLTDWNVSAESISHRLTPWTRAVIIVHYAGQPCRADQIRSVTNSRGIPLVEDCAHAAGSRYRGLSCGTFGSFGCFSFFSNKNLSTGEGGMMVTEDRGLEEKARLLRSHGMTSLTVDRHMGKNLSYDVVMPGFNYRIDEVRSALGLVQLSKLDSMNRARARAAAIYRKTLAGCSGVIIPWSESDPESVSSHHIFPVLLPPGCDRQRVMTLLAGKGIQTSIHYPSFRSFWAYRGIDPGATPVADEISKRVLTLPMYPELTGEQIGHVCCALAEALDG